MTCGLLGRKLSHSYSPAIHGLLGSYDYALFEKEPEELEDFICHGNWDGLNVTIPYKKEAAVLCDALSDLAKQLGSVNTLVRRADGTVFGDNTDAWGFEVMANSLPVEYMGKKALVLGSGGASVTVQAVLKKLGCEVVVISRSGENNYENLYLHKDAAILVNTTPVGMYPHNGESPVDLQNLPNLQAVLDVVYNPARTKLILDAEEMGIPCVSGLLMLVAQAARACEIWTDTKVSFEKIEEIRNIIGSSMENIILIGMPGSGKSTIGKFLAAETGRLFVDSDEEIVKKIGDIPAFFAKNGEEVFRKVETEVLKELGKQSGLVLATGGGVVTREENYRLLHQNGRMFWLQRDLDKLPIKGRPLSQRDGAAALYEKRKPLYERFADVIVDNNGSLHDTCGEILRNGE